MSETPMEEATDPGRRTPSLPEMIYRLEGERQRQLATSIQQLATSTQQTADMVQQMQPVFDRATVALQSLADSEAKAAEVGMRRHELCVKVLGPKGLLTAVVAAVVSIAGGYFAVVAATAVAAP